jgi:phosphohistidine phosphatase
MKRLYLLRHAKSSAGEPGQADHERPLNARGRRAAERIGDLLAERGDAIELVLCSSARRTRETLERVLERLGAPPRIETLRDLYLASSEDLLQRVRELPDDVGSALLVGHNPGIGELAQRLAARGSAEALRQLREKFPTAALAILRFESAHWSQVARGAQLESFVLPRELEDG